MSHCTQVPVPRLSLIHRVGHGSVNYLVERWKLSREKSIVEDRCDFWHNRYNLTSAGDEKSIFRKIDFFDFWDQNYGKTSSQSPFSKICANFDTIFNFIRSPGRKFRFLNPRREIDAIFAYLCSNRFQISENLIVGGENSISSIFEIKIMENRQYDVIAINVLRT